MKRAPIVALAAIVLFLGTLAWSTRAPEENQEIELDFSGIDTLVVRADRPDIELQYAAYATHLRHDAGVPMKVRREGSTLTIVQVDEEGYRSTRITAPRSLRRIVLDSGDIIAKAGIGAIDVEVRGSMSWKGPAQSLRIDHAPRARRLCEDCDNTITIHDGAIDELSIRTRTAKVVLSEADRVGQARLELGTDAGYELAGLQDDLPKVTVVGYRIDPGAPLKATIGEAAAQPPAEPPRKP